MNKNSELQRLSSLIENYKEKVIEYQADFDKIEKQEELALKDLIRKFEAEEIESVVESGSFTYIIGGDGRSLPWDERREGKVIKVIIPDDYFVTSKDVFSFANFLKIIDETLQAIFINNRQILPR